MALIGQIFDWIGVAVSALMLISILAFASFALGWWTQSLVLRWREKRAVQRDDIGLRVVTAETHPDNCICHKCFIRNPYRDQWIWDESGVIVGRAYGRGPAVNALADLRALNALPPEERAFAAARFVERRLGHED